MILGTAVTTEIPRSAALHGSPADRRSYLPFVFGLFAVLPYSSLLLTGNLVLKDDGIYSDYGSYQLPVREFVSQELAEGRFSHWIPWLGCGIPLHATQQVGICYPLLTPLLFFFNANMAIKASLFLHVILCYWGQYRLGRQLKLSVAGASIAGLICSQSGFLCTHLAVGHVALVLAYTLIPWLLSSVVEICESPSPRGVCRFAAVVAGLLLTGHPQIPYYALLFGGFWAIASLVNGVAASRRRAVVSAFTAGLIIGISIAGVQIFPTWELFRNNGGQSQRGTAEYASTYALNGLDLFRMVIPALFGNPMVDIPEFMPLDFYHEKVCYLGLMSWCLFCIALFRNYSSRWPWGAAALALFGIVISLGDSSFLFTSLCRFIPGLTLFRCPGRCLSVVSILVALLAGRGYDALTQKTAVLSFRAQTGLVVTLWTLGNGAAFVVDNAIAGFDYLQWIDFAKTHVSTHINSSICIMIVTIFVLTYTNRIPATYRLYMLAIVLLIDLGYFNVRCIQYESDSNYALTTSTVATVAQGRFIDGDTGFRADQVRYSRFVAAAIRDESRMIGTNEGGVLPASCEAIFNGLEKNPDVLMRLAACSVVVKKNGAYPPTLKEPLPRVWFCPMELAHYLELPIDAISEVDVDSMVLAAREIPVKILLDGSQQMTIEIDTKQNGTLIVADTWYREWKASIDGRDHRIEPVWHCFRGVPLEAGLHTIEFRYKPAGFWMGLWISVAAIILLIGINGYSSRSRLLEAYFL